MADVSGKFFSAKKVRTGVSPSSPGVEQGETLPPVNPPGSDLNSVGLSMPSAFNVANSPLTSNGTIAVTGAGTTAQYIRGDGSLASFPSLTGYVPYTGATQNVDLGEFGLDTGFVNLDTTPTNTPTTQGTIYWDDSKSTAAMIMNGTTQHIGQDTYFYVKNSTGSSIAKGTAVRFDGTDGASGHLLIAPFLADGTYPSAYFMGVTAEAIGNGGFGQVTNFGEIEGINTSGYTAGALLYASTTVAGGFQTTAPVAPNNIVLIAAAVNSKNNGAIIVRPQIGSNINNDEGVKITSPTTGQLLQLQSNGLWENKTKAQVLGGTSSQFVKGDGSLDSTAYVPTSRQVIAGAGLTGGGALTANVTLSHADTSSQASVDNSNGNVIQDVTLDTYGHITALGSTNLDNRYYTETEIDTTLTNYQLRSEKGQPSGYASLDSNGKVPLTEINDALIGNVNYQGLWNASTNSPTLANPPSSGTKGYYYIVSTAGTFAGISFEVGDWIISNGSAWQKVDNTDAVSSVFGRTGNVTAANGDYTTAQVTESGNLYFTQARVSANTDVAANTAARHNAVTLGTANGLSLNVQQLSLQLASGSTTGALSGTDWSTFNNKENAITAGTTAQYFRGDKTFQTLNTAVVPELTNLYFTQARVSANTDVAANTAARHNAVTLGTANGLSLSTQQLSLGLASGSATGALSSTDWATFNNKENAITAGTTAQYFRGDKTFQTLNTSAVPESGNLYFTNARAIASTLTGYVSGAGTISSADTILSAIQKLNGNIGALVTGVSSVNGLTGAVTLTTSNIGEGTNLYFTNARARAALSFAAGSGAYNSSTGVITIPTDNNQIANGAGYITGNQTITLSGDATGSGATSIIVTLANSGVTAGTYNNVATQVRPFTVDAKGRITSIGTAVTITPAFSDITGKPTTLAGYGITDAVPSNRTITINGTTQDLSANRTFNVGTVTSVGLSSATSGVTIGSTPVTSSGTITLAIATASGSQNGLLSSTDWTTFNNKQNALTNPVTGTGAAGQVAFWDGTTTQTGDNGLFWDNTNQRLGVGTITPLGKIHSWQGSSGQSSANGVANGFIVEDNQSQGISILTPSTNEGNIFFGDESDNFIGGIRYFHTDDSLTFTANNAERMRITSSGNVLIGTTVDDGGKLKVLRGAVGTVAQFRGAATDILNIDLDNDAVVFDSRNVSYTAFENQGNERWRITSAGILQSNGAQTIQTSTGNLTLATAAGNGDIVLTPNGTGIALIQNSVVGNIARFLSNTANGQQLTILSTATGVQIRSAFSTGIAGSFEIFASGGSSTLSFGTASVERMHITSSGNVGIGTTTFAYSPRLAVASVGQNSIAIQTTDTVQGSAGTILYLGTGSSTGSSTFGQIVPLGNGGTSAANLVLQPTGSNGNVLIGTTTDNGNRLRVNGNSWFDGEVAVNAITCTSGNTNTFINPIGTSGIIYSGQGTTAVHQFLVNSGESFAVTNTGIRTNAPTGGSVGIWKLGTAVNGTVNANRLIRIEIDGIGYDLVARQII